MTARFEMRTKFSTILRRTTRSKSLCITLGQTQFDSLSSPCVPRLSAMAKANDAFFRRETTIDYHFHQCNLSQPSEGKLGLHIAEGILHEVCSLNILSARHTV